MPRPDGRVQPGQRLDTAFSARAWNRAQDAADLVLGDRGGLTVPPTGGRTARLVVPCTVSTIYNGVRPGHAVRLAGISAPQIPIWNASLQNPPDDFVPIGSPMLSAEVSRANNFGATSLFQLREVELHAIGIIVGGAVMPTVGQPQPVDVCISGVCVARIRVRASYNERGFVRPAFARRPSDTAENLHGCLEVGDTGQGRLISLSPQSGLPYIAQYGGSSTDLTTNTSITWGLIVL